MAASSLAQTAIAFLIDLAERGEVDPWDVKVIEVMDRFLNSLRDQAESLAQQGRTPYEANLSESGQAFLYASMLVLLKADAMVRSETTAPEDAGAEDLLWPEEDLATVPLPRNLERHLHRRAAAVPPKQRRVTLDELIQQLEAMAELMADHQPRRPVRRAKPQAKRQAVRAIAQLAHQENLSEIAAALEQFLDAYWDTLEGDQCWLEFEQLIQAWPNFQPEELKTAHHFETADAAATHERVGVFWGLLFLSAQSKVELSQQVFYQDLKVRNLNRVPLTAEEAGLAPFILPD